MPKVHLGVDDDLDVEEDVAGISGLLTHTPQPHLDLDQHLKGQASDLLMDIEPLSPLADELPSMLSPLPDMIPPSASTSSSTAAAPSATPTRTSGRNRRTSNVGLASMATAAALARGSGMGSRRSSANVTSSPYQVHNSLLLSIKLRSTSHVLSSLGAVRSRSGIDFHRSSLSCEAGRSFIFESVLMLGLARNTTGRFY